MTEFILRSGWSRVDRWAAYLTFFGLVLLFMSPRLGEIEGRLFPVVSKFEVTDVQPVAQFKTQIRGSFSIDRPGCDFRGVDWFVVGPYREALTGIEFGEGPKVRSGGFQEFGPWFVFFSVEQLKRTRAAVRHQCPGRPWETITHLYP